MKRRLIKTVVLVFMAALLAVGSLAGCTEKEKEEGVIYVPLFIPFSGSAASGYTSVDAATKAIIKYINETNPIPGVTLKLLTYDSQMDQSRAIPGYNYLVDQGAKFIACADTTTAEALKSRVDDDEFPVFLASGTSVATSDPGYVFCIPMDYYDQIQPILKWIMDTWDYDTEGRNPKIGVFGWNMSYGIDREKAVEDYCTDDYPDKFDYVGAEMAPYGTTSWTSEVEALKNCDYIIVGAFAGGASGFIGTMRTSGYDTPTFCMLGTDGGFMTVYASTPGKEAMDGTIMALDAGYWRTDSNELCEWYSDLLENYYTASPSEKDRVEAGGNPSAASLAMSLLAPIEYIREALKGVDDPDDLTGEMIYNAATTMTFDWEGYPTVGFTDTQRELLLYEMIYQYSATDDDWHVLTTDWILAPGYED